MNLKTLLIVPPLAVGLGIFALMTSAEAPVDVAAELLPVAVRVQDVAAQPFLSRIVGFGRVEAARSWSALSEVEGRITEMFPGLDEGTIVDPGDLLLQVDRTDYEITIQKTQADIASAQATLTELRQRAENTQRLLEIETRALDVTKDELARVQALVDRGVSTQANLDTQQRALLGHENAVISLMNTVALFPAQITSAEATLAVRQAELVEAKRLLNKTTIVAPFRARVSTADVAQGQYVRTGNTLLELDATDTFEVIAAFQPNAFGPLVSAALAQSGSGDLPVDASEAVAFFERAGITATVALDLGGRVAEYPATIVRFRGTIDDETGAFGIAVHIKDPLIATNATERPPLSIGSFVSVVLEAPERQGVVTIPRAAVSYDADNNPFVYLADVEDRLRTRQVTLGAVDGKRIIVEQGLSSGDRVVLSAPRPPVEGLALTAISVSES